VAAALRHNGPDQRSHRRKHAPFAHPERDTAQRADAELELTVRAACRQREQRRAGTKLALLDAVLRLWAG
jgi:hypothetical protein